MRPRLRPRDAPDDGYVIPPTEPGLGIELDEEVADRHPYDGDRLHLEMREDPLT